MLEVVNDRRYFADDANGGHKGAEEGEKEEEGSGDVERTSSPGGMSSQCVWMKAALTLRTKGQANTIKTKLSRVDFSECGGRMCN